MEILGEQQVVFQLRRRSHCHLQKTGEVLIRASSAAFGDICTDRTRASANLTGQTVGFFSRERFRSGIQRAGYPVGTAPNFEIPKVLHNPFTVVAECRELIAKSLFQKLLTKFFPGNCLILPANSNSNSATNISDDETSGSSFSTSSSI